MRARISVVLVAVAAGLVCAVPAAAATSTFSGKCDLKGPIAPHPPITVVPKPGPHFDYTGTGTCTGTRDGADGTLPAKVRIRNGSTLFDTCELGPDFNLHADLVLGRRHHHSHYAVTVQLARIAVIGPLTVTTDGGGRAFGIGRFSTTDSPALCATSGVVHAALEVSFTTSSPFVGESR